LNRLNKSVHRRVTTAALEAATLQFLLGEATEAERLSDTTELTKLSPVGDTIRGMCCLVAISAIGQRAVFHWKNLFFGLTEFLGNT
jgi:hypothetical protein